MKIDRYGIEFLHDGDAVLWVWPWQRGLNGGMRYYSLSFHWSFHNLNELDDMWDEFWGSDKKLSQDPIDLAVDLHDGRGK